MTDKEWVFEYDDSGRAIPLGVMESEPAPAPERWGQDVKHTKLLNITGLVIPADTDIQKGDEITVVVESLEPEREYVIHAYRVVDGKGSKDKRKDGAVVETKWTYTASA